MRRENGRELLVEPPFPREGVRFIVMGGSGSATVLALLELNGCMGDVVGRPSARSDSDLIRAARRDPAAFEELYERHAMHLQQWILAQTRDVAASEDLLAETFAQAWRSAKRFKGEDDDAGAAWLYGIARNLVRRHFRRGSTDTAARRRLGITMLANEEGGLEDALRRVDAARLSPQVLEAFRELNSDQQRAIGFRVVESLGYEEIAAAMQCSPVTARSHVFRGLAQLRSHMKSTDEGA